MTATPVHILHVFSSFGIGGLETRMAGILNHLGQAYRHSLIALDGNMASRERLSGNLAIEVVSDCRSNPNPLKQIVIARNILNKLRPDLLATYNWGAVDWAMANRLRPVCRHIHMEGGFGIEEAEHQLRRRVLYRRIALSRTRQVVVPSYQLRDIALNTWKLAPDRVRHIPNGVDCERFRPSADTGSSTGGPRGERPIVIGTVAALRPEKNLALLIRTVAAASKHHDVRLMIVGDGPELGKLTALADRLRVSDITTFAGQTEAVEDFLATFDIFALSSHTEQMPSSVLQAMAAAKPVAAWKVGDLEHILAPANRSLLPASGDQQGFTEVVERLLSDAELRRRLGVENRAFVEINFPLETMLAAFEEVFRDALRAQG